ncbi:hypothetical protein Pelo_4892 [Pelomyxa schiedti]|nr:hypothetical protein Pelo_4892 [Pelomyxa schiedti]
MNRWPLVVVILVLVVVFGVLAPSLYFSSSDATRIAPAKPAPLQHVHQQKDTAAQPQPRHKEPQSGKQQQQQHTQEDQEQEQQTTTPTAVETTEPKGAEPEVLPSAGPIDANGSPANTAHGASRPSDPQANLIHVPYSVITPTRECPPEGGNNTGRWAYVFYVASDYYGVMAAVNARRLYAFGMNPRIDVVAVVMDGVNSKTMKIMEDAGIHCMYTREQCRTNWAEWQTSCIKLYTLGLEQYDRVVYHDTDGLKLHNSDYLFDFPLDEVTTFALPAGYWYEDSHFQWFTARMVFKPSLKLQKQAFVVFQRTKWNDGEVVNQAIEDLHMKVIRIPNIELPLFEFLCYDTADKKPMLSRWWNHVSPREASAQVSWIHYSMGGIGKPWEMTAENFHNLCGDPNKAFGCGTMKIACTEFKEAIQGSGLPYSGCHWWFVVGCTVAAVFGCYRWARARFGKERYHKSGTAAGVAAIRAVGTFVPLPVERTAAFPKDDPHFCGGIQPPWPKRLCEDEVAAWFLDPHARFIFSYLMKILPSGLSSCFARYLVKRITKGSTSGLIGHVCSRLWVCDKQLMDDITKRSVDEPKNVIILGAGFDSRAIRFSEEFQKHNVTVHEFDLEEKHIGKMEVLRNHGVGNMPHLKMHILNLNQGLSEALDECHISRTCRTYFILEGLLLYLPPKTVDEIMGVISTFENALSFVEILISGAEQSRETQEMHKKLAQHNEPALSSLPDAPDGLNEYLSKFKLQVVKYFRHEDLELLFGLATSHYCRLVTIGRQ